MADPVRVAYVFGGDIRPYRVPFLDRLARRPGLEVTVYAGKAPPRFGAPEKEPAVEVPVRRVVNHFWPGGSGRVAWQSGLLGVLRSDHDVIVCSEIVSNLTVWLIRLLHRRFGKRLVLIGYFYRPQHEFRFRAVRSFLRRRLRASSSAFIPYTQRGARELIEEGVPAENVFVMRNTLDTEALMAIQGAVTDQEKAEARRLVGAAEGQDVIVFLGRLRKVKRLDVLIEAMSRLQAADDAPILIVIGDGPEKDDLETRARGLPVRFVGPLYDEKGIAPLLAISKLMVLPGQVGLTCVHGFAAGLACVTTTDRVVTQSPEYEYVTEENSVILADLSPDLLADTIRGLMADVPRLEMLSKGARASARRLTMEAMAEAFSTATRKAAKTGFSRSTGTA